MVAQAAQPARWARTSAARPAFSSPSKYSSSTCWHTSHFIARPQVRTDAPLHLGARPVQIGLQLRDRKAGDLGNLFVTALLKNFQREDHAFVLVERRQRRADDAAQLLVQQLTIRRQFIIFQLENSLGIDLDALVVALARAQRLAGDVLGDAEQPG